jgi:hypothetical protein
VCCLVIKHATCAQQSYGFLGSFCLMVSCRLATEYMILSNMRWQVRNVIFVYKQLETKPFRRKMFCRIACTLQTRNAWFLRRNDIWESWHEESAHSI